MMLRLLVLIPVFFISACGSQKPVPVDHYYRLPDISLSGSGLTRLSDGIVYVALFETDGLHRERALVYSNNEGLELKQFHYQHWIDSPARLIRDHLVQYLRTINAAPTVVTSVDPYPEMRISGRIRRFDRIMGDPADQVVVALELRADREDELLHIKDYQVTETVTGSSASDTVTAFDKALLRCFAEFVKDVHAVL